MSSTVATTGDSVIRMNRAVAVGARAAAQGLPTVESEGLRRGHAEMLEGALAETRATLGELTRVADIGASGAEGLGDQDSESGRKFGGVREVRRG